jgi:hypothetical protein
MPYTPMKKNTGVPSVWLHKDVLEFAKTLEEGVDIGSLRAFGCRLVTVTVIVKESVSITCSNS